MLESRLRGVEVSLLESVGRLEQRLALMEHRIHALEKSLAGKIIIESNQWENMDSRVLLLETKLALTSAQVGEFNIFLEVKFQFILQLWHNAVFSQNSL